MNVKDDNNNIVRSNMLNYLSNNSKYFNNQQTINCSSIQIKLYSSTRVPVNARDRCKCSITRFEIENDETVIIIIIYK